MAVGIFAGHVTRMHTWRIDIRMNPDTGDDMTQKLSREEREMQKLLKKIRKKAAGVPQEKRWQDPTTRRDDAGVEEALDLFREMKRREF